MEQFAASWLTLREPVDHRSRPAELLEPLNSALAHQKILHVLDLGAGTGSNYRYLSPKLERPQQWQLYDHDAALLAHATQSAMADAVVGDLQALIGPYGETLLSHAHLITASALLDLVSAPWLDALIDQIAAHRIPALFSLSYDGQINSLPATPADQTLQGAVNRHQCGDKGFGPALGPAAGAHCAARFRQHGYTVWQAESPWQLDSTDAALQKLLIDGWVKAANAVEPDNKQTFIAWQNAHLKELANKRLTVGHQDILALPR